MARLMMDLGAHKGLASRHYLDKGWDVVAVEAHPELAGMLLETFRGGDDFGPRHTVVSAAITPNGEPARLYLSGKGTKGETHSIHPHRVKRCEAEPYIVTGTTLAALFKSFGVPHYLKVDIEGSDLIAILQLHELSAVIDPETIPPKYLSVELCQDHPEEALEMFAHLGYMGYDRFSLEPQSWDRVVDIEKVNHGMNLVEASAEWFAKGPLPKDIWYDLHALRSKP